mmetsp:Transcript_24153/g.69500  ORF Transcript_24153/g.69500 Transcript_24153/m.69500 type:complete len:284 (-) Transcript_24153:106-957(-)
MLLLLLPADGGCALAYATGDLALDLGLQRPHGLISEARRQSLGVPPPAVHVGLHAPELQLEVDLLLVDTALDRAHGGLELLEPRRRPGILRRVEALHVLVHPLAVLLLVAQGPLIVLDSRCDVARLRRELLNLLQHEPRLSVGVQLLRSPLRLRLGQRGAEVGALLADLDVPRTVGVANAVQSAVLRRDAPLRSSEAGLQGHHAVVELRRHVFELALEFLPVRIALLLQARHQLRDPIRKLRNLLVNERHGLHAIDLGLARERRQGWHTTTVIVQGFPTAEAR